MKQKLLVICGLNATGKSDLAVEIAKKFCGEIISADSRQVYKGLDIGSGKITEEEKKGIPHYLIDVISPKRRFTALQYQKTAQNIIKEIHRQNKLPIICGGTGFYIQAVTDGLVLPEVLPNMSLRNRLSKLDVSVLYGLLQKMDPQRAKIIDKKNPHRVIRAIEIIEKTGLPVPVLKKRLSEYNVLFIGLKTSIETMRERIARRLEKWLRQGMVDEVANLRKQGISWHRLEEFGLEYRLVALYLQKKINFVEMKEQVGKEIVNYTRRQTTWFKKDKRIKWFDISRAKWQEEAIEEVEMWYNKNNR